MSDTPKQGLDEDGLEEAKRIMSALVKQPPKPHEDMRVGERGTPTRKPVRGADSKCGTSGKKCR